MMGMPAPVEQHRKLEALTGNWVGEEKMHPSPWDAKGGTALAKIQSRMDLDGFFVIADYVQERGGQVSYRGHGVFGFDPADQGYTMHWFDSMGSPCPAPAKGKWEGNRLAFNQTSPMGHSRYTYTFEAPGRYRFLMEASQDGKTWAPFLEGTYSRK